MSLQAGRLSSPLLSSSALRPTSGHSFALQSRDRTASEEWKDVRLILSHYHWPLLKFVHRAVILSSIKFTYTSETAEQRLRVKQLCPFTISRRAPNRSSFATGWIQIASVVDIRLILYQSAESLTQKASSLRWGLGGPGQQDFFACRLIWRRDVQLRVIHMNCMMQR